MVPEITLTFSVLTSAAMLVMLAIVRIKEMKENKEE